MVVVRIQHNKVAFLAYLDATDAVCTVQGSSTIQGEGGNGFFDSKPHVDACQSESQWDGTGETTARIEIGGKSHGTAGVYHFAAAGVVLFQGKSGQRKQCCHSSGLFHGTDALIRGMQQMVGRDSCQLSRQLGTAQWNDFVGMEFQPETIFTSCQ